MAWAKLERVAGAVRADPQRLERPGQVLGDARRAREVQDPVDRALDGEPEADVMLGELERRVVEEVGDLLDPAGGEIVDGQDLSSLREQRSAQVRADEAGAARHHGAGHQRPTPT